MISFIKILDINIKNLLKKIIMKSILVLSILVAISTQTPFPEQALLHAPFTAFINDTNYTLNLTPIASQSKLAA